MLFSNTRVLLKWPCNYSSLNSLLWIWMFGKATQSYLTVQISCDFFLVLGRFLAFILVQPMIDQVLHSYLSFLAGSRVYHLDAACHALLYLINPARKHCVTLDFADRSWIKKGLYGTFTSGKNSRWRLQHNQNLLRLCAMNLQSCGCRNGCSEDGDQVGNQLQSVAIFEVIKLQ